MLSKLSAFICLLLLLEILSARAQPAWDTFSDTWVATGGLGRRLPGNADVGPARLGRYVGIFYFLWLEGQNELYDLSQLRAANPTNPAFGPNQAFHFWGEPLFGHYRSDDEFVLRKHAQMLSDAGVDVVILDVTNGFIYEDKYLALCRVWAEMRRRGQRTPQIMFLANSRHQEVVTALSRNFYSKNLYRDLWFMWQGKPLLLTPQDGLSAPVTNFFTLRQSWAWSKGQAWFGEGKDKWPWLDFTPQNFGWHESPQKPEEISVAVAQHPTSNIGRSYHKGRQPAPGAVQSGAGLYFSEQWEHALTVAPEFIFVTSWNEWIAQRFISDGSKRFLGRMLPKGKTYFVDTWDQEFSRDIEPMKGGHGDNYYYQLVNYIRRYKGVRPLLPMSGGPVVIDGKFDDWRDVTPEFRDTLGDPVRRDHPGWKGQPKFVNHTGRNDLAAAKVTADATNINFYVRTSEPLTSPSDPNWMLLFIDADSNPKTGWLGYDFVVNRSNVRPNVTTLERCQGTNYVWGQSVDVSYRMAGNELELAIPRAALGITTSQSAIDFKWVDNIKQTGDWSDFTLNGDAAPNDRFNYRAILRGEGAVPNRTKL